MLCHRIKKYPDLAFIRFRTRSVFKNSHPGERIKKVADSYAGFAGYVWTEAESAKKKLRIQKYPDTLWMWPKNTIHRQHTERGQLLRQLLELYFHIRFELYFHIRFQACFACLSSEGFNKPFFFHYSSLHFNDLRSMKPN